MLKIIKNIVIIYVILILGFIFTYIFMGQPLPIYFSWGIALIIAIIFTLNFSGGFRSRIIKFLIYIHPVLLLLFFQQYDRYPYKQTIVLPEGYEGLVIIEYNQKEGAPKEYSGGFLGIGSSSLITVDSNGYAKTQHKFLKRSIIPNFIREPAVLNYFEDAKVYYKNDLKTLIPKSQSRLDWYDYYVKNNSYSTMSDEDSEFNTFVYNIKKDKPVIFYDGGYSNLVALFIVTKPSHYEKYFEPDHTVLSRSKPEFKHQYQQKIDSIYELYQ